MAEVIIMPKLGFNMDEGQLVKWCKAVGDTVSKGEVFFEINTDKTTMPVESAMDGVLLKVMLAEGDTAAVFTPIAVIGQAGEDPEEVLTKAEVREEDPAANMPPVLAFELCQKQGLDQASAVAKDIKLTPKAQKLIQDEGLDLASVASIPGTGFRGGITARDIKASPLAIKVAGRDGVDLAHVQGSGPGGKIMKADVQAVASAPCHAGPDDKRILSVVPYQGVRKIIGDRLAMSKFTAPHLYFTESVDTTNLSAFRKMLSESGEEKIAVSDLLVLAASKALQRYPEVNTSLVDGQVISYGSTNIGIAVAGDNGLIVPVVKNVQEKSLSAIARETRSLVERAKAGRLAPDEFTGGTFTISNLGMFGIENFTAIINPPESAIISVSSVRKTPVVVTDDNGEDTFAIRPMMNIQLSVDHRVIDGLLAAQFIAFFKELLENPLKILM